ncbi:MAG: N-acetyltransferase family protein [Actinomycetota bacterium]
MESGSGSSVHVRDAVEADLAAVTDIFNQAIPGGDAEWTESLHTVDERRSWMRDRVSEGRPVIVAIDDADRVIGVASYGDFRDSTCREGFRFVVEHSVYLDDAARGTGAADRLMDELEARAAAAGMRVMLATIDGRNERSIAFHSRRGFREVGRLPAVGYTFGVWRDFVILQLDLHPAVDGTPPSTARHT